MLTKSPFGKRNLRIDEFGGATETKCGPELKTAGVQPLDVIVERRSRDHAKEWKRTSRSTADGKAAVARIDFFIFMPPPPPLPFDGDR
jgi:hypothetical protein